MSGLEGPMSRTGCSHAGFAIFDERGRVQGCHLPQHDLGDAWEWADDPRYPERFASLAYRIGTQLHCLPNDSLKPNYLRDAAILCADGSQVPTDLAI